ncbi:MAG: glutamine synthetase family protein [Candidatus Eisenbacteria bacterium]
MNRKAKTRVLDACKKNRVKFVQLWFTDILGQLKSLTITTSKLAAALEEGESFDGSSVEGFARIYESDLVVLPDPSTFQILPWTREGTCAARMICDVVDTDLRPYEGDPRYILKRSIQLLAKKGFAPYLGPEIEYFYFADSSSPQVLDVGGYFDLTPADVNMELREKTVLTLEAMGIPSHASHHEVATSQHELDLKYDQALKVADAVMTARLVIKEVARQHNVYATFMPKPIRSQNGSGMHVHQSLFKKGRNAFFDRRDKHRISKIAKKYITGLLKHSPEMTTVTNQWVNSYKRLVPGFEAPAYICWGSRNRSALVRVPLDKPDKEAPRRVEFRCPDPACNPYLAFAVMLRAGLKGMEEGYELPDPVELDVYRMSPEEREKHGIACLPDSLYAAIEKTAQSTLVRETLGDALFEKFIENKRIEWDNYRTQVTQYELTKYLPIL